MDFDESRGLLCVGYNREFNLVAQKEELEVYLKINTDLIRQGLIKEIGANNFSVLLAIACYMNDRGECYPTQRQLSEITGLSLTTINKSVQELLVCKINGKPILERELKGAGVRKNSFYNFTRVAEEVPVKIEGASGEKIVSKTAKDYALHFCKVYEEVYGFPYTLNYGRDYGLIKGKLMPVYTDEQIMNIMEVSVRQYDKKWRTPRYTHPTISMVCGWLANEVLQILRNSKVEKETVLAAQKLGDENSISLDKFNLL